MTNEMGIRGRRGVSSRVRTMNCKLNPAPERERRSLEDPRNNTLAEALNGKGAEIRPLFLLPSIEKMLKRVNGAMRPVRQEPSCKGKLLRAAGVMAGPRAS